MHACNTYMTTFAHSSKVIVIYFYTKQFFQHHASNILVNFLHDVYLFPTDNVLLWFQLSDDTAAKTCTSTVSASCTRFAVLAVNSSFSCLHSNRITVISTDSETNHH